MTGFQNFNPDNPLLLVGCGRMGGALLEGWLQSGLSPDAVWVVDPDPKGKAQEALPAANLVANLSEVQIAAPRMIVLAVKPQMMVQVLPGLSNVAGPETAILSIAAGTTIDTIEVAVGAGARVIRSMPNTPAAIGYGVSGIVAGGRASEEDMILASALLGAVGSVVVLHEEKLIDAVTAVSGSGPAYVFHLIEAMAAAGIEVGLDADISMQLARETIIGAGRLLEVSEETAGKLRHNVTSPNGTTQAALEVLMGDHAMEELMKEAVRRAYERAGELAKES